MSYAEIEAELDRLNRDELRQLALSSWSAFLRKEVGSAGANDCDESDPDLLRSLDEAITRADATPGQGHAVQEVRSRLSEWTSR